MVSGGSVRDCVSGEVVVNKSRGRKARPPKIKSSLLPPKYIPDGKERYAYLPLPAVPSPSQSRPPSPTPRLMHKESEPSPVIDIQLETGDKDGLVEWFENFRWGEGISAPSSNLGTATTAGAPSSAEVPAAPPNQNSINTYKLPLLTEPSVEGMFRINEPNSVLHPAGVDWNGKPSRPALSPGNIGTASKVVVCLGSPGLTSCHGLRSSFASSNVFGFDLETGEELSYVDEEQEVDDDGLCQRECVEILSQQVLDAWELSVDGAYDDDQYLEQSPQLLGDEFEIDYLRGDMGYEDDSGTSNELDTRLKHEIEMILNGIYDDGSSDCWRDGTYSTDLSPELRHGWEGEITVEPDINTGKVEGQNPERGVGEVMSDEGGWNERPRTRYITGRNSMLDSDVIFCLRGIENM